MFKYSNPLLLTVFLSFTSLAHAQQCPTTYTYDTFGKPRERPIRALSEKLFTKAELEKYYQELLKDKADAVSSGQLSARYSVSISGEKALALWGCFPDHARLSDDCTSLLYAPRYGKDTITPRIEIYACHRKQGWPSAVDYRKEFRKYDIGSEGKLVK